MTGRQRAEASRPPKAVIFDIGRVIVRVQPERALGPLTSVDSGRDPSQIWSAVVSDHRWVDWQEGRMDPQEWHKHLTRQLNTSIGYYEFCAAWNRALHPVTILEDSLFSRLAEQCRLAVLSNTDPLHCATLDAEFTFLRHFPVRIYSCRVGASKPSPAIYRAALSALQVAPAEALYIDDIPEYFQAALDLGLDAIQFIDRPQLIGQLAQRGLPVPKEKNP